MAIMKRAFFPEYINDIYIMLTEKCPMRCEYCYIKNRQNGEDITKETLDKLMSKVTNKPRIIFFGGEPLLHVDLMKWFIDKYKNRCSIFQTVTSAAVNFDRFYTEIYKTTPNFELQMSWDGYDGTRLLGGVKNISKQVFDKHIQMLLENNDKFQIRSVINDTNVDNLYNLYHLFKKLSLTYTNFCSDMTIAHQKEFNDQFPNKIRSQLLKIFSDIEADASAHRQIWIPQLLLGYIANFVGNGKIMSCNVGSEMIIRPNGDIYPCTMLSQCGDKYKLGSVYDAYLNTEIIDSLVCQPKECEHCVDKKYCMGGCRYEKEKRTGNLDIVNPCYCDQAHTIISVVKDWMNSLSKNVYTAILQYAAQYIKWTAVTQSKHVDIANNYREREVHPWISLNEK